MSIRLRWSSFGRSGHAPRDVRGQRGRGPRRRTLHVEPLEGRQMLSVTPAVITLGTGVADGATLDEAIQPGGVVRVEAPAGSRVITQFVGASGAIVEKTLASAPAGAFPVTLSRGDVETLRDGLTHASVWVVSAKGGAANRIQTFTIDTRAPAAPTIALGAGIADGATVAEAAQPGGVLRVTGEWAGWTTVQIYGAADPGGVVTKQFWSVSPTAVPVALSLDDVAQLGRGLKYASVWVRDAAGNATNGFTTFTIDIPEAPLPQVSVVPLDSGVTERGGAIDFAVTLSAPSALPVRVSVATADGTARAADGDYEPIAAPQTLRFAPGETMKTVRVAVIDDAKVEDDETFSLVLSEPRWATLANPAAVATIRNDDAAVVSVSPATVVEGDAGTSSLSFMVSLSAPSTAMVYVSYATADGTATAADRDFQPVGTPRRLTFLPGETAQTVEIPVFGDAKEEADETLSLVLVSPVNATLGTATATGTIRSDDWRRVSVTPVTVTEGNTGSKAAVFRVALSAASALPISVRYATVDGTATAADWDYLTVPTPQLLSFAPGETERFVDVTVYGDTKAEADETFGLVLSAPVNAVLPETATATAMIRNDDVPSIIVSAEPVAEGGTGTTTLVFRLALSMPSTLPVTVTVATADGTAFTADQDYQPLAARQISFAPGETVKTVGVTVYGDTVPEADETVSLVLWSPVNAAVGTATATGTIRNDDFPTVSVSGGSVTEGNSGTTTLAFRVSLSVAAAVPVSVRYATVDATATAADQDFQAVSPAQVLVFAPGETVKTVGVNVTGDTTAEPDETFTLVLSDPDGAILGTAVATGTIRNDDAAPPPPPPPPPAAGTWTIMVYMTGDNLNTFARDDINEMEQFLASLPASSGVSIIVAWDQPMASAGTAYATGNGSQAAWRTYGRSVLQADTTAAIASTFDLSMGEKNTGDPATLVDFMQWGAQQRPAANYALQLWGHGGGLTGSQFDTEPGGIFFSDALTIVEVSQAIRTSGVPPLKLVSYDNCLMGMAEVGFALSQQFSGHFVASGELVPGAGQNYVTAYSALATNAAGKTSADIGASMVSSYQQQYSGHPLRWDTFSSVATSGYSRLATALSQFVTATESLGATDRTTIRGLVMASPSLSFDETAFRDLGRFMARVVTATALPQGVRDAATAVGAAVTAMVAAKTADARGSSGIAIYLPTTSDSYLSRYTTTAAAFCQATRWDRFARWLATGARDAAAAAAGGSATPVPNQRRTTAAATSRA